MNRLFILSYQNSTATFKPNLNNVYIFSSQFKAYFKSGSTWHNYTIPATTSYFTTLMYRPYPILSPSLDMVGVHYIAGNVGKPYKVIYIAKLLENVATPQVYTIPYELSNQLDLTFRINDDFMYALRYTEKITEFIYKIDKDSLSFIEISRRFVPTAQHTMFIHFSQRIYQKGNQIYIVQ